MPARALRRMFGRGGFERINKQHELFEVGTGFSKAEHVTKPYTPMPRPRQALTDYLTSWADKPTPLMQANGRRIRKPKPAIHSLDANGNRAKARFQVRYGIPVNMANVQATHEHWWAWRDYFRHGLPAPDKPVLDSNGNDALEGLTETQRDGWLTMRIDQLQKVHKLAYNDVMDNGYVPMTYVETSAGRLQGQSVHLQNVTREVRNACLAGCWDYDIENCHFAIFAQLARQHGYEAETVRDYMAHKEDRRRDVAASIGVRKERAKKALLMLLYGARQSENWRDAIPEEIGVAAAARLYRLPFFKALHADVKAGRAAILAGTPVKRGKVYNVLRKPIDASETPRCKLAHLQQGIEAQMLHAIGELHGDALVLLMHDGWVSETRLDVPEMVAAIREKTGFEVELSEGYLSEL